jgi:hypothetical protein
MIIPTFLICIREVVMVEKLLGNTNASLPLVYGWQFIVIIYLGLDFNNISYSIKFSACVTVPSLNDSKIGNESKCITKEIFPLIKNILMVLLKVLFIFKGIINKSLYPYVL